MKDLKKSVTYKIVTIMTLLLSAVSVYSQDNNDQGIIDFNLYSDNMRFNDAVALVELDQTDKAFKLLHEYLEIFPRGVHRHSAYRYIAEIYRDRFDYLRAADTYLKIFEEFSPDEKAVAAYYEAGVCYSKMGYDSRASRIFTDILEKWPDSPQAARARTRLTIKNILEENPSIGN